ncbi:MAG: D-Ala-D-Ala carboxypeptidase family metallohydrolase [Bacillota bacterium]
MKLKKLSVFIIITAAFIITSAAPLHAFSLEKADFAVNYKNYRIPFREFSLFVMPGESIKLEAAEEFRDRNYKLLYDSGKLEKNDKYSFKWKAPEKVGLYELEMRNGSSSEYGKIKFKVFVMFPYQNKRGSFINNYRIGKYPSIPQNMRQHYQTPRGFVEVTPSILDVRVSPHFTLGQFICGQIGDYPKYLVLKEDILLKMEYFLIEVNQKGIRADTFNIMSAYRTPYYNSSLGNSEHSRHVFGDAVDIFIDQNQNGVMDDLNGDGRIDIRDADVLYRIFVSLENKEVYSPLVGGIAKYRSNGSHGPFIHLDSRGFKARW